MQSPRLHFSRLGTVCLQAFGSSSRLCNGPLFSFHGPALNTRGFCSKNQPIAFNNDRTRGEEVKPSVNRALKIRNIRSSGSRRQEPSHQKPSHSEFPKYSSEEVIPNLDTPVIARRTKARPAKETAAQARWLAEKMDKIEKERSITEELKDAAQALSEGFQRNLGATPAIVRRTKLRSGQDSDSQKIFRPEKMGKTQKKRRIAVELADDIETPSKYPRQDHSATAMVRNFKLTKTQSSKRENRAKRQRARRQRIRNPLEIWRQLETVVQQLELVEIRIEVWKQLAMVEKLLGVVGKQVEMVERRIEAWRQLDLAETQLAIIGRQVEIVGRRIEARRQLDKVERELLMAEGQLQIVRRGVEAWTQQDTIRKLRESATMQRQFPRRGCRRSLSTPPSILARWLDTEDLSEREQYWLKNRAYHPRSSLPLILVVYLRRSANPNNPLDEVDQSFLERSTAALERRGLSEADIAEWAWIVSAQDTKAMIGRFTSTPSKKPSFLLLEILRRDIPDVMSLKLLLIYSWGQLLGRKTRPDLIKISEIEIDSVIPWSDVTPLYNNLPVPSIQHLRWESSSFFAIFRRLLYQARRIWPPAIVSISHMVAPFMHFHLGSGSGELMKLDNRTHTRLCKLFNQMLRVLALPTSINPLKSMVHNWQAQRVLLEMTTHFEPRLLLDRNSYRAVAQVLAASKKLERESRAATLRTRSWPPWRVEQDGMDAQRLPEDDLSRVVATTMQAKESGYSEGVEDRALRVLGGQEPDGTPTIPTRKLLKFRSRRYRLSTPSLQDDPEAQVWTARIESTRDVQEAWSAFIGYQEQGRQPTMSMYFAMIVKLQFEASRSSQTIQRKSWPGDGKEVLPPSNDNFSSFYQSRLQPPTIDELYGQMRHAGIRPSGRFLTFLVQHAKNPNEGIKFLHDGRLNRRAVALLKGFNTINPVVLKHVPEPTFAAFISLLCRLAPRIIPTTTSSTHRQEQNESDNPGNPTEDRASEANEWKILELGQRNLNRHRLNPLLHCADLLKMSQTTFRPAWYSLFSGLARRGVIVDRSLIGDPKNDVVAWKVLAAAVDDFHNCGLELDPQGFLILCIGLEKALLASFKFPEREREDILGKSQIRIVVNEFMKMSEVNETTHRTIPKLLHPIEGVHLHAYVRVLGLDENYDGLMNVLQWMVKNHTELDEMATQSQNGSKLIRRTIIAIKVFFGQTQHESDAEDLVNSVESWNGWPRDSEAQNYIDRWSGWADGDEREP